MKAFIYKGEVYLRCIPGKALFRSTMVHEVVNRGDIFAMNVNTQEFTVISGKTQCTQVEVELGPLPFAALEEVLDATFFKVMGAKRSSKRANEKPVDKPAPPVYTAPNKSQKAKLEQLVIDFAAPKFAIGELVQLNWWSPQDKPLPVSSIVEVAGNWYYQLRGLSYQSYSEGNLRKVPNK